MRVWVLLAVAWACSSPGNGVDGGTDGSSDSGLVDAGTVVNCFPQGESDKDGEFGAPTLTFAIPSTAVQAGSVLYLADIQATFPQVDWKNLDRLYIPAGQYSELNIHNLPMRAANRPLVITNQGGQVRVGGIPGGNYLFSLGGGSNWVLTGRYDPIAKTGDAAFPGHRGNCYGNTRGTYGILVDDAFHEYATHDGSGGVAELVSGSGRIGMDVDSATNFELQYIEITRVTFAGLVVKTQDVPTATMDGVRIHDNYIHDTMSEGLYLGSTGTTAMQHVFTNLQVYNNRFVRTGSEALQLGQLATNSHTYNNVTFHGALNWRHNFECTGQDNNVQYGQRYGQAEVDHNIAVGAADSIFIFFPSLVNSDPHQAGDGVVIHDNLFSTSRKQAVYAWELGGSSTYVVPSSAYTFKSNFFNGLQFTYADEYPGANNPGSFIVFASSPMGNPYALTGNMYDGTQAFAAATGNVTATNNTQATVAMPTFNATGLPSSFDYQHFEVWSAYDSCQGAAQSGKPNPTGPPRTYAKGDFVMYDSDLYELVGTSSAGERPDQTPKQWLKHPPPVDDLRLGPGSAYAGFGLLDTTH